MPLMALIAAGHRGQLIQTVAGVLGVEEPVARAALERQLPDVARRLDERASETAEQELVLDVLAEGSFQRFLDDPRVLFGRQAVRDGEDLLDYAYGSVAEARERAHSLGSPAGLDRDVFARLMTLSAGLLLGAMARRLEIEMRARAAEAGSAGMLKRLGSVAMRAIAEGSTGWIHRGGRGFAGRMEARRRRGGRGPAHRLRLDALLGDVLGDDARG